jgi:hypothetical protein
MIELSAQERMALTATIQRIRRGQHGLPEGAVAVAEALWREREKENDRNRRELTASEYEFLKRAAFGRIPLIEWPQPIVLVDHPSNGWALELIAQMRADDQKEGG